MNKIAEHRNRIGISQSDLSKLVGVTPSAIGNYESGTRNINVDMCWKIVIALNSLGAKCTFQDVFPNPQTDVLSEPQTNTTANR
ncbi:TPA: helix-turn-helix transcriptional regulator [Vibrio cholerae]|nr:helix-turn-helix transcriptional regulator [Vibrio cholerae]